MFCPNCGHDNLETAAHCAACGTTLAAAAAPPPPPANTAYGSSQPAYGQHVGDQGPRPPNHLVFAIVATVLGAIGNLLGCCCLPVTIATGITAIIFANKVNTLFDNGNPGGALDASGKAKLWSMVTAGLGALFFLWFIVSFVLQSMGIWDNQGLQQILDELKANQGG